jgi:hypothetical protein
MHNNQTSDLLGARRCASQRSAASYVAFGSWLRDNAFSRSQGQKLTSGVEGSMSARPPAPDID